MKVLNEHRDLQIGNITQQAYKINHSSALINRKHTPFLGQSFSVFSRLQMFTAPHERFCDPPAKRSTSPRHSQSCRPPMKAQEPGWNSYGVGQKLASLSPRVPSTIGSCFLEHQPGTLADSCLQTFINRKQQGIMADLTRDVLRSS